MTTSTRDFSIVSGPSKWDLMMALFDRKDGNCRKVQFCVNTPFPIKIEVQVDSVQALNALGEFWNIEGISTKVEDHTDLRRNNRFMPRSPLRVFIYFMTDIRNGHIRFFYANQKDYPPIAPETRVRTTQPNFSKRKEWTDEAWENRQWGVPGEVLTHHGSHGLCYEVQHEDESIGFYDPSELEVT